MTPFDFKKFVATVHKKFENQDFSDNDIENLLTIDKGYNVDKGMSSGKKLKLNRLLFSGDKNGEQYQFDQKFYDGVNIWIGNNSKGKTSIFKIIKLCLTGSNKLDAGVNKWIDNIYLEFNLGKRTYCTFLDKTGYYLKGSLYTLSIDNLLDEKSADKEIKKLWETTSVDSYKKAIELLFYQELDFYSLQYTQKDSAKDSLNLRPVGTSWTTYFESIFLESANYNKLTYGNQAGKVVQMLFGLVLTYPINRLTIKKQLKENKLAQLRLSTNQKPKKTISNEIASIESKIEIISERIKDISTQSTKNKDFLKLQKEYDELVKKEQENTAKKSKLYTAINMDRKKMFDFERKMVQLRSDYKDNDQELTRLIRNKEKFTEYIEIGSFFSSLEISYCPHCDYEVTKSDKIKEKEHGACSLCSHDIDASKQADVEEFQVKVQQLTKEIQQLETQKNQIKKLGLDYKSKYEHSKKLINEHEIKLHDLGKKSVRLQIETLSKSLQTFQQNSKQFQKELSGLYEKRGELKQKLKNLNGQLEKVKVEKNIPILEREIEILSFSIDHLSIEQQKRSNAILEIFEKNLIRQLHTFGLNHYTDVKISPSFKLFFSKHGIREPFEDTSIGEQVRIKLAFYLSIIELDITHGYGKHPRFIILDTPGKEEADDKFLEGLKETLKQIENKHKDYLQLFVGTKLRELEGSTAKEKHTIKQQEETFF